MVVGFFVDFMVYLIAIFAVIRFLGRLLRTRGRKHTNVQQTRDSERLSQSWIEAEARPETTTSEPAEIQGAGSQSHGAVPTGRSVNVARDGRIYRCEEVIKGDERYTRVCQVDRRGRQQSPASVSLGSLDEVAPRVL